MVPWYCQACCWCCLPDDPIVCLAVTEPCSTGLGGDCFCLYFEKVTGKVHGLNGSGRSPKSLTLDRLRAEFPHDAVDFSSNPRHIHSITVPGAAAGWCDALKAWGSLPMSTVLAPAISLARDGFPVAPVASLLWNAGESVLKRGPHAIVRDIIIEAGRSAVLTYFCSGVCRSC
jgi:gamma-glutamyltranspeptidase / glutathione hydrolase